MSVPFGFNPHVHMSPMTPYPHTDYRDVLRDKLHLTFEESFLLSQRHNMPLQPTQSVWPSHLMDLLRQARREG